MTDTLRVLVAAGLLLPLLLLRLSAEEFGAAEYDETREDWTPGLLRRLSWYVLGFALVGVVYVVYPRPRDQLSLVTGHAGEVVLYALGLAVLGTAQAMLFALFRYRDFRFPRAWAYPDATLNAMATAFIDEATFRGILLGLLLTAGVRDWVAILVQAIIYGLATRLGARGRHPYMLLLALAIGILCGYATVHTAGIGAAVFGHLVTRFALFVTTGHAGQVTRRGSEPEEVERVRRPPRGWEAARAPSHRGMPEPRGIVELEQRRAETSAPNGAVAEAVASGGGSGDPPRDAGRSGGRGDSPTEWWTAEELAARNRDGADVGASGSRSPRRSSAEPGGADDRSGDGAGSGPEPDAPQGDGSAGAKSTSPRRGGRARGDRQEGRGPK